MANGKWQMANGKWQMANGKWGALPGQAPHGIEGINQAASVFHMV
jgi:hypothetical protein